MWVRGRREWWVSAWCVRGTESVVCRGWKDECEEGWEGEGWKGEAFRVLEAKKRKEEKAAKEKNVNKAIK